MADVFLSYARPNAKAAERIADALRDAGLAIWFDKDLPAHRSYSDVIEEQLEAAAAVVVLWSKDSAASQWVRSEANRARETGRLVQLRLDDTRLPMPFDQVQCADVREWNGDRSAHNWQVVETSVSALVGKEPRATSPTVVSRPFLTRRNAIIGGGAATVVVGAVGGLTLLRSPEPEAPPRARQLLQSAMTIMQDGRPEEQDQATAYLIEATRIAPDFAMAWGALAVTYSLRKYQVPTPERAGNEDRCRSAARRALQLDPKQPFAECALALLVPPYRNWAKVEQMGRQLANRHPGIPLAKHILADVLGDVGRWGDASKFYVDVDRTRFVIPLSERAVIQGIWSAGDLQRAEAMLDGASERWPRHRAIWNLRTGFLMHTGRANEAILQLENESGRPPGYPDELLKSAIATARALAGSMAPSKAVAINLDMLSSVSPNYLTYLNHKIATVQVVAQRAVALGDNATALELLQGYYFGKGQWAQTAPPAGDDDRNTITLFEPPMRGLWRDPGFDHLVRRIGLTDYWRQSGTAPDFRRTA